MHGGNDGLRKERIDDNRGPSFPRVSSRVQLAVEK